MGERKCRVVSLGSVCRTHWVEPAARTEVRVAFSHGAPAPPGTADALGGVLDLLLVDE